MTKPYMQEEKYLEIGGRRVCYIDAGQGPPLLFVHGLGGSIRQWAPNIEYFKRSNRVVALDLPGFGKSEWVDSEYSVEFFAETINEFLEHLGIERATVIGNSLGGLITIHLALYYPETVENIVLVDTAGGHKFPEILKRALRRIPPKWLKMFLMFALSRAVKYRAFQRMAGIYVINPYTKALLEEVAQTAERGDLDDYVEAYVRTTRTALNVSYYNRLAEIQKPTLIVWGQKDIGIPLSVGQKINTKIRGSYLVAIPRAAHVSNLDQPELFNAALSRFLIGLRPASR